MSFAKYKNLVKSLGFQSFLWTQFLGAFNDNVFKIVISMFAVNMAGGEGGSRYVSMVGAVFILPFCLFSGYAGWLADVHSKRTVLITTKSIEVFAVIIGLFAFWSGSIQFMLATLFLMALHSTFFSPAKYGILPEMLPEAELSRANGILEMSTFLAIILGTASGTLMFAAWKGQLGAIGFFLIAVAAIGFITSFGIPRVERSGADKAFRLNPWSEIGHGILRLRDDRLLLLTVAAISYFWFMAALLQMDILLLAKEVMLVGDFWVGILITFLALGIGVGSITAGRLSGDKVEPGLVPLGAVGMGVFAALMSFSTASYWLTTFALVMIGFFGRFFMVPLNALLQQRSSGTEKGRMIATTNFVGTVSILLASVALWVLRDVLVIPSHRIILVFGVITIGCAALMSAALPAFLLRFLLWLLTHTVYKIRIVGGEHAPRRGPALLVCNHISFADGLLVGASLHRFVRFMIYRYFYDLRPINWALRHLHAIPISNGGSREVMASIQKAREELMAGHVVCVFAEGAITRTGNLLPFKKGFERIVEGLDVPVIPMHLDRVWGSAFSFHGGRFFKRWARELFRPVTVSFGAPMPAASSAQEVREAVMELGGLAVNYRRTPDDMLHLRFLKTVRSRPFSPCIADGAVRLSRLQTYARAASAAGWLCKHRPGEEFCGIYMPPSVDAALANLAVMLAGKTAVNMDIKASGAALASIREQCGIKTVITSRSFEARAAGEGAVCIEEIMEGQGRASSLLHALSGLVLPYRLLAFMHARPVFDPGRLATVIFTGAADGEPRGVMLTHHNIISNIEGLDQVFSLSGKDAVLSGLPFYYAFGYTAALWFPLASGMCAAYHADDADAPGFAGLAQRMRATMLLGYPQAFEAYIKGCGSGDFKTVRYAVSGGGRLKDGVAKRFREKFGAHLLEGWGATELSPVISVNVPDVEDSGARQMGTKPGTVGQPIPGMTVKVVHPETGERQSTGSNGMLLVKGPSVMAGYWGNAGLTAEVLKDGWFATGVFASICDDGFIRVLDGRPESRGQEGR
ncbi:MAG: MFS transporter [Deltaproteobacteria bacterium]|nr:MFS transporter [Deltaproteobacteria bacterium]